MIGNDADNFSLVAIDLRYCVYYKTLHIAR